MISAIHCFVSKVLFSVILNCIDVLVVLEIQFYVMYKNIPLCSTRSLMLCLQYTLKHFFLKIQI